MHLGLDDSSRNIETTSFALPRKVFVTHVRVIAALVCLHFLVFARYILRGPDGVMLRKIGEFDGGGEHLLSSISLFLRLVFFSMRDSPAAGRLPYVDSPQDALWWPITWLTTWLFGFHAHPSLQQQAVSTLLVAGVGTYALAYHLWNSRVAAFCAALSFSLSNSLCLELLHLDVINAYAHIPWLLWASLQAAKPGRLSLVLLSAVIFSTLISGDPGVIARACLCAWIVHLFWARNLPRGAVRSLYLTRVSLSWALAVGMAAVHWLPALWAGGDGAQTQGVCARLEQNPGGLFEYLGSFFYSFLPQTDIHGRTLAGAKHGFYIGLVTFPFLLLAWRRVRGWSFSCCCLLLLAAILMELLNALLGGIAWFDRSSLAPFLSRSVQDAGASCVLGFVLLSSAGIASFCRDPKECRGLIGGAYAALATCMCLSIFVLKNWAVSDSNVASFERVMLSGITMQILCIGIAWISTGRPMPGMGLALALALDVGTAANLPCGATGFEMKPEVMPDSREMRAGGMASVEHRARIFAWKSIASTEAATLFSSRKIGVDKSEAAVGGIGEEGHRSIDSLSAVDNDVECRDFRRTSHPSALCCGMAISLCSLASWSVWIVRSRGPREGALS